MDGLENLVREIFADKDKTSCNYLIDSPYWIRHTIKDGCNYGDQWSEPNFTEITLAIRNLIESRERQALEALEAIGNRIGAPVAGYNSKEGVMQEFDSIRNDISAIVIKTIAALRQNLGGG